MKKILLLLSILCFSVSSYSQTVVPKCGFYGGLGASFNIVNYSAADARTLGLSEVYINGENVSSGYAGGPYEFPESSDNTIAPSAQIGYFNKFKNSTWLWGSKLTYSYIGSTSTSGVQNIPQVGSNTTGKSFTGDAVVQSFEYSLNQTLSLTPYIGKSMGRAFFYIGAGPSLSETKEKINEVVGYAYIKTATVNISGAPTNFSATNWVWGLSAIAGGTYFFNQTLFLDFTYSFNPTESVTNDFNAPFANSNGPYATSGKLIGSTSSKVTNNSFMLTINKIF